MDLCDDLRLGNVEQVIVILHQFLYMTELSSSVVFLDKFVGLNLRAHASI